MSPTLPVQLPPSEIQDLVDDAIVWASQHGLLVGASSVSPAAVIHAPMSLLPAPFPRGEFCKARGVAPAFNLMIDAVSRDLGYLHETLERAAAEDEFTAQLLRLSSELGPRCEDRVLAINRSDYMLDEPSGRMLQVELNTIASSFGCLSNLVGNMHQYITSRLEGGWTAGELPANEALEAIPAALAAAVSAYGGGVVLMVVQPGERNAYDQQWLQTNLWVNHRVRTIRRSLAEVAHQGRIGEDGKLRVGEHLVAVSYLRAGYTPDDYPSQVEWDGRKLLETSDAFKCPSVAYQLAGTKKVQQDLARPEILERFAKSPELGKIRQHFAGLWSLDDLDDASTVATVEDAIRRPSAYVLKPQREGGGNNLYDEDLATKLKTWKGLSAYILMQRILPPVNRSVLIRNGSWVENNTLQELGVYGTFIRVGDRILLNETAGHLVRTKADSSNEGGVAAGFAVLDSPYLV
uniref:Glutathione synthetase n=1 Tax=Tetraselmis sp. GSL018 TaxID=582737 RepID=A0A061S7Y8_9CHLO